MPPILLYFVTSHFNLCLVYFRALKKVFTTLYIDMVKQAGATDLRIEDDSLGLGGLGCGGWSTEKSNLGIQVHCPKV